MGAGCLSGAGNIHKHAGMMSAQGTTSSSDLADLRQQLQRLRALLKGDADSGQAEQASDACDDAMREASAPEADEPPASSRNGDVADAGRARESRREKKTAENPSGGFRCCSGSAREPESSGDDEATISVRRDVQEVRHSINFLLGFASRPQNLMSPQDRRLALDLLSVLLPEADDFTCDILVERLLVMEAPPKALLSTVLELSTPEDRRRLVEEAHLPDDLLQDLARHGDVHVQEGIVRRRHLPACATWELVRYASSEIVQMMLRNAAAVMTESCWWHLLRRAVDDERLHTPLATRADLPRHVAWELFWHVGGQQRRHIISRFASDSQQLETLLEQAGLKLQRDVDFLADLHVVLGQLDEDSWTQAASRLAQQTGFSRNLCERLLRDKGGEPLAVLLKAHGVSSRDFVALMESMQKHRLATHWTFLTQTAQPEALYGTISINRARMILLYWDWRCRGIGPYRGMQALCE